MADVRTRIQTVAHVNGYLPPDVRVSRKLCEGGQGIVFEGHVFQERAAVKIYLPGQNATRIDREVNVMKQLRCDAVVRALWSGSVAVDGEDLPVVATQLLPGEPLDKALSQRRLTEDQIWTVVYDVADAIQNLWKLRIVHRDLKPSNVILLPTGRCCVIDLGLARHLDQSSLRACR